MSGTTNLQELAQESAQPLPSSNLKTSSTSSVNAPSTSTQEPTPPSSPSRNTDAIQETSGDDARDDGEEAEATSSKPAVTSAPDNTIASSSSPAALAAPSATSMASTSIIPPNALPQDSTLDQLSTTDSPDTPDEARDADEANAEATSETERPSDNQTAAADNTSEIVEILAAVSLDEPVQEQGTSSAAPLEVLRAGEPPKPAESMEQADETDERVVEEADEGEHQDTQGPPDLPDQEQQQADLPGRPRATSQRIEIPDDHPLPQLPEPEEPEQPEIAQRRREPAPIIASPAEVAPVSISVTNPSPATPRRSPFVQYQYSSLIPREEAAPPPRTSSSRHRQPSVVPLPPWQPDAEAHSCPICGNSFTMFYRRHHCRKCGRVVCAPCSNHRLVMPKAFVVSPPAAPETLQDQGSNSGAMEVRICEDCMEGRERTHHHHHSQRSRRRTVDSIDSPAGGTGRFWEPEFSSDAEYERRRRRSSAQDLSVRSPTSPHHSHSRSHHLPGTHHSTTVSHHRSVSAQIPRTEQMYISRGSPPARTGGYPGASSSRRDAPLPHTPPQPHLKETDYCPICTLPLPPVGDDGDETAREAHILDCIRLAEASVSPRGGGSGDNRRRTTASANSTPVSYSPLVAPTILGSGGGEISASSSPARSLPSMTDDIEERTRRMNAARVGRMVIYRATEKDTFAFAGDAESSAGGQKAECVICFEEFEVGEAIARLECLCRYHKKCIREWFDRKGNGDCPVHAVHE